MKRRHLLASAAMFPAAAWAQGELPLVGVVRVNAPGNEQFTPVFKRDLARLGFEEGKNYRLKVLFAEGDVSLMPRLAATLVTDGAKVLVAFGNSGVIAAQKATKVVPIVAMANDLASGGLVASMARPGGNTTGISIMAHELEEKRLEILHEIAPSARRIGVLRDPGITLPATIDKLQAAAGKLGLTLTVVHVAKPADIAPALEKLAAAQVEAVAVLASPLLNDQRATLIAEMTRRRWPAIWEWPETVEQGGLASYAPRISLVYRHVAVQVAQILRGAKPADLPVEQPTTFTLAINTSAAKAIGLKIPDEMLLRADVVVGD